MTAPADGRAGARPRRAVTATPLALTMLLLLLVALGASLTSPWELSGGGAQEPLPLPAPIETVDPPPAPLPVEEPGEMSTATKTTLLVVGLLSAVIAAYLLVRATRRLRQAMLDRRSRPEGERSPGTGASPGAVTVVPELRTGVEQALGRLRGATTSTDAVIAAWLALEDAAAASGAPRTAAQTPTELTVAVLRTTPAPPEAVTRLLHLYHLARFTGTPLTTQDVAEAQHSLDALAGALSRPTAPESTVSVDVTTTTPSA